MTTYQAVMLTKRGGPEVLQTVELPLSEPGPGQVRVRIRATGAGGTDLTMRRGKYAFAPPIPFVPGYELVGDVEKLGDGVTGFVLGQRVAALVVHGGYADYRLVAGADLVPVPDGLDDGEAVALILNYVTAYQALVRVANVHAGQTVLVTGASGGVGTALLDLCRVLGVRAIGAADPKRFDVVREFGGEPIDGRSGPVDGAVRRLIPDGVDVAFDGLGGRHTAECVCATKRGGMVVGYGFSGTMKDGRVSRFATIRGMATLFLGSLFSGRKGRFYGITLRYRKNREPLKEDLPKLFALLAELRIQPKIFARLPLLGAREANELLERGGVLGKIVNVRGG